MKKILFVDMHRDGRSPSQRFRYEQYVTVLEQNGFIVHHSFLLSAKDDFYFYQKGKVFQKGLIFLKSILKRVKDVIRANHYDFIFIQREAFFLGTTVFEKLFAQSKAKLIFDFDDAIWIYQTSSFSPNKSFNFLKNPDKTSEIIKLADQVVAGNEYLAEYARQFNNNVAIIPTTIETNIYLPKDYSKSYSDKVIIGWSGSKTTIDHFKEVIPALQEIKHRFRDHIEIRVIGDENFRLEDLGIIGQAWNLNTEVDDLRYFDIGIMPLPDDEWSKGKCGLKGLQYMALGIATIMSPVGVNTKIITHNVNGLLCSSHDDWQLGLSELIDDEEKRRRLGATGRETVLAHYSVDSNSAAFLSLFN